MKKDEINIEILPDGLIKTTTDKIGQANHSNAESFLREMARLAGGVTATKKNPHAHDQHHHHGHDHDHDHEHENH